MTLELGMTYGRRRMTRVHIRFGNFIIHPVTYQECILERMETRGNIQWTVWLHVDILETLYHLIALLISIKIFFLNLISLLIEKSIAVSDGIIHVINLGCWFWLLIVLKKSQNQTW